MSKRRRVDLLLAFTALICLLTGQHVGTVAFSAPSPGRNAMPVACPGRGSLIQRCSETSPGAGEADKSVSVTVSIAKASLGSGVLSLSAGVAAFTHSAKGLHVALAMLACMTVFSASTFLMVAEVSSATATTDFAETWAASASKKWAWVPRFAVIMISALTCVVYSMIIGDLISSIISGALGLQNAVGGWKGLLAPWISRGPVLAVLSVTVLLPLCLAQNFSALAFTSVLGLTACFLLAGITMLRMFDGSYIPGGRFFELAPLKPAALVPAKAMADVVNARTLVHLSTCSTVYMTHGMSPTAFAELAASMPAGTSEEAKLRRFGIVTAASFGIVAFLAALIMTCGFCTFGANTNGLLLASYATADGAATLARACVMASVLFGFPLYFVLLRKEIASSVGSSGPGRRTLTALLMAGTVALATLIKDLGKVQAIAGATMGNFIVFVAPGIMARGLRKRGGSKQKRPWLEAVVITSGVLLSVLGLAITLRS